MVDVLPALTCGKASPVLVVRCPSGPHGPVDVLAIRRGELAENLLGGRINTREVILPVDELAADKMSVPRFKSNVIRRFGGGSIVPQVAEQEAAYVCIMPVGGQRRWGAVAAVECRPGHSLLLCHITSPSIQAVIYARLILARFETIPLHQDVIKE